MDNQAQFEFKLARILIALWISHTLYVALANELNLPFFFRMPRVTSLQVAPLEIEDIAIAHAPVYVPSYEALRLIAYDAKHRVAEKHENTKRRSYNHITSDNPSAIRLDDTDSSYTDPHNVEKKFPSEVAPGAPAPAPPSGLGIVGGP